MEKFEWIKKGKIFSAEKFSETINSHVQNPCPFVVDDKIRVFFNTRPKPIDNLHTSFPTFIDLDINNPQNILYIHNEPLLSLGDLGCFDEFGCMTSSVITIQQKLYMYYVGWQRMVSVPYNWAIGLAYSKDNGKTFEKLYKGPIIGSFKNEPYLQNGCYVFSDKNSKIHMFYSSGINWIKFENKMESQYLLMHAVSEDGINWNRESKFIIPKIYEDETQTTPTIFYKNNYYHMIFSSRHSFDFRNKERGYKVGYAYSSDLENWHRNDTLLNLNLSDDGWDSEMICYPQTVEVDNKILLFYCGNNFGTTGFGYAILK